MLYPVLCAYCGRSLLIPVELVLQRPMCAECRRVFAEQGESRARWSGRAVMCSGQARGWIEGEIGDAG